MSEPVPGPDNDYQATPTQTFSREVWNVVMASIAARLKARELLEATFEALIADGTQQALDLIAVNVAPQLSEIAADIAALQAQVDGFLDAGAAPNALQLGGQSPAYYLALEHATGTLPVAQISGVDAAIDAAIDALKAGVDPAYDTLVEIAAKLADDDTAIAGILTALGNRLRVDTAAQGLNGTQQGNALTNLGFSALGKTLAKIADAEALRTTAGLGTAATKDVGTGAGNVIQLDGSAHMPAALLADTPAAVAGTGTSQLMTPARTAEAIAALAKGWEQIGSTQTLTGTAAYVEQSWPPGTYREVMCLALVKGTTATTGTVTLRNSGSVLVTLAITISTSGDGLEVKAALHPGVCQSLSAIVGQSSTFVVAATVSATVGDRIRVAPNSSTLAAGSVFAFFGLR